MLVRVKALFVALSVLVSHTTGNTRLLAGTSPFISDSARYISIFTGW